MARKLAYQALKLVGKNWGKSSLTIEKNRGNIVRLANRLERRFGLEDIHNLKTRHLATLFEEMKAEHLSASTLSGYATAARSIAFAIGKQNIVPRTNQELGFSRAGERFRPIHADSQGLEEVRRRLYARSEWQGLANDLRMQFGLRAKESLLSVAAVESDGTEYLEVRGAKGGRPRRVPVENDAQKDLLGRIRQFVQDKGQTSLIPNGMTLKQAYDRQRNDLHRLGATKAVRANAHALRHAYVQSQGARGVPTDELASRIGHGREEVLKHYGA